MSGVDNNRSTRERVLRTLLKQHRCTINDLAKAVDINPISVRHHIAKLEAQGLVISEEERHGVGRPRRVYYLSEIGMEHFPTRYMRLTIRLLQQLKQEMSPNMVNELFSHMAEDLVDNFTNASELSQLSVEDRLNLVKEILTKEGFEIEWERKDDQYHIREVSCPYFHVGENHPEVCSVDRILISTMLEVPAERIKCVLNGDTHCTYVVPATTSNFVSTENP